jgi:hypothetical protein
MRQKDKAPSSTWPRPGGRDERGGGRGRSEGPGRGKIAAAWAQICSGYYNQTLMAPFLPTDAIWWRRSCQCLRWTIEGAPWWRSWQGLLSWSRQGRWRWHDACRGGSRAGGRGVQAAGASKGTRLVSRAGKACMVCQSGRVFLGHALTSLLSRLLLQRWRRCPPAQPG